MYVCDRPGIALFGVVFPAYSFAARLITLSTHKHCTPVTFLFLPFLTFTPAHALNHTTLMCAFVLTYHSIIRRSPSRHLADGALWGGVKALVSDRSALVRLVCGVLCGAMALKCTHVRCAELSDDTTQSGHSDGREFGQGCDGWCAWLRATCSCAFPVALPVALYVYARSTLVYQRSAAWIRG